MAPNPNSYVSVEGFKKWDPYFDFAKDMYSDVSAALVQKDFEMATRTMRELIDNTCPYHNSNIKIKVAGKEKNIDYAEYFEMCVEEKEEAIAKEGNRHLSPDEKREIFKQKDVFYKQIRFIRRLIMKDLAKSLIIPGTETKKEIQVSSLLRE